MIIIEGTKQNRKIIKFTYSIFWVIKTKTNPKKNLHSLWQSADKQAYEQFQISVKQMQKVAIPVADAY